MATQAGTSSFDLILAGCRQKAPISSLPAAWHRDLDLSTTKALTLMGCLQELDSQGLRRLRSGGVEA